jgi:hypothetical protein
MGGGGTVTTVTVSAPLTVATPTTTPNITIPQATGGVSGYLSSADWTTFNNKLGTTLPSGYVWVGNGSNVATPVTITGDGTINSSGILNLNTVPITKGGTGITSLAANRLVGTNGVGSQLQAVSCSLNQVVSFNAGGDFNCQNVSSLFSGVPLVQNGNSLAQNISMGTNDAYSLNLLTGGLPTMTLSPTQNVGIGTTSPSELLDIETSNASPRGIHVRNSAGGTGAAMAKFEDIGGRSTVVFQNTTSGPFAGGVAHAGGITTMTSSSALILGTNNTERLRIDANNGNIGVGTIPSSYAKLQVNGSIVAGINTVPSGNTADFTYGNTIILQNIGGSSITLLGMIAGGKYTIVVEDATSRTYTFTGCPGTVRFSPANGFTTASYHSIYEFFVTGTNCYVKWVSGF